MPTTPVHALPYPAATDPADVPYDLGNLAQRLDVVIPSSGGVAITPERELGYAQVTVPVTMPAITDATAQANAAVLVALPALVVDAVPHYLEFYCHVMNASNTNASRCALFDGATLMGWLGYVGQIAQTATMYAARRFTPTAGTKTYSVRGFVNGGSATAVAQAGAGVGGSHPPMWARLVRCQV